MGIQRIKFFMVLITLFSGLANAQENNWQNSLALEASGKYMQAALSMESILRESPNNELALMRHGWLNYLQGLHNDSLRDYNKVLTINPKSLEARLGLTLPLIAQQRWRETAMVASNVLLISPWDYTAHIRLMLCEEAEQKWEVLAKHASEFSARFPSDAAALVYLAHAEAWQGHVNKAKAAYSQVLERTPSHLEATAYLKNNH